MAKQAAECIAFFLDIDADLLKEHRYQPAKYAYPVYAKACSVRLDNGEVKTFSYFTSPSKGRTPVKGFDWVYVGDACGRGIFAAQDEGE